MNESIRYYLLKHIEDNSGITQRELAQRAGISLGKVNYCLKALMEKGLVKAENFRSSPSKLRYLYKLTPTGLEEKARVTYAFLKRKQREYEELKEEIAELKKEANVADKDG
jgi:EPS-associated MarR family transcriptional regulator